jgi:hypothetical protein
MVEGGRGKGRDKREEEKQYMTTGVSAFGDSLKVRAAATRCVFGVAGSWLSRPMAAAVSWLQG